MVSLLLLELVIMTQYTSEALISIHPEVIIRQPGQELTIECNSSSSNSSTATEWTLPNNTVMIYLVGRLVIENVTVNDSGVYRCSVGGESASTNVFICQLANYLTVPVVYHVASYMHSPLSLYSQLTIYVYIAQYIAIAKFMHIAISSVS